MGASNSLWRFLKFCDRKFIIFYDPGHKKVDSFLDPDPDFHGKISDAPVGLLLEGPRPTCWI
ncbi:MAG: hypothetical protein HY717_05875 [Planctomycetes bacterium]|nr:hypothetical protein [Planctomycetota bacterium]